MATKTHPKAPQQGPSILSRMAGALSFARLAILKTKISTRIAVTAPEPARQLPKVPQASAAAKPSSAARGDTPAPHSPKAPSQATGAAEAEGRRSERARCAGIILSGPGQRNSILAVHLATQTDATLQEALAVLEASPPARNALHLDRASMNPRISASGDPPPAPAQATAARWDRAMSQVQPARAKVAAVPSAPPRQPRSRAFSLDDQGGAS